MHGKIRKSIKVKISTEIESEIIAKLGIILQPEIHS